MGVTAESATSLMRIYFFVAQWIGCLPFRLDFQTFKPSGSAVRSSLCLIIPCLLLFIEVYVTEFLWSDTLEYDVAIQFFRKTSFFVHYSTCLLIFFTAFFKRKLHMIAVEKLISFAKRYHLTYEFSEGSTRSMMILVFVMLVPQMMPFFKLFYDIFDIIMGNSGTIFNIMFFPVSYIYTIPIICFLCLCFYFERLNAALEKVKYTNKTNSHFVGLRIAYSELFDILQKLNDSLDLQLSLLYIHLFSRYIVVSFDLIYTVFVDKSRSLAYSDVTRQSFFLLKFYTLSQAGDMLASEAGDIGPILHKIALENREADEDFKDDIQLFSLSILHYKKEPKIMGYMNIDFTLLFSVIAAVVSYCVIVSQFQTPTGNGLLLNFTTPGHDNFTNATLN